MFTREIPDVTLEEVRDNIVPIGEEMRVLANKIQVDLTSPDPKVVVTDFQGTTELAHSGAIPAFGSLLGIPESFLNKMDLDLAEILINAYLQRSPGPVTIRYSDKAIHAAYPSGRKSIDPVDVVDIATRVIPNGKVIEWFYTFTDFHLDVVVADQESRGAFGDKKVGDYSLGGLRFNQNLKSNAVPTVDQYWYRLVCTNGMMREQTERLSLGRQSADDWLIEFEDLVNRTFFEIEGTIEAFYNLRNHSVENVEQAILRWTKGQGINEKTRMNMLQLAPEVLGDEQASQFDVVNFITNLAVDPSINASARFALERAGGSVVGDHHYCSSCQSRLD